MEHDKSFEEILAIYENLINDYPDITRKGKKTPYTSLNGNMFTFVGKQNELAFRLSKEDKVAYEAEFETGDVIQHNSVMRGYVPMTAAHLADKVLLKLWFEKSWSFMKTLPKK